MILGWDGKKKSDCFVPESDLIRFQMQIKEVVDQINGN